MSAREISNATGVDPLTYSPEVLASLGVYPVVSTAQPFNEGLYDVARSFTIVGGNAEEIWTAVGKDIKSARAAGNEQRAQTAIGRINNLSQESGFGPTLFSAVIALPRTSRQSPFDSWITRQEEAITELANDVTDIEAAAAVDDINDIVSAAWGSIDIGYDPDHPLDIYASDFTTDKFYSKNYAQADLELYFPQTLTTISYSGGFAATTDVFVTGDHTVQVRVASTGVVIDEFIVPAGAAAEETEFGYRKYLGISTLS